MWLFIPSGFVSVVQDRRDHDRLLVRGRLPGDIERVLGVPESAVATTPTADYRFRVSLSRERVAEAVRDHVMALDYDNVKMASMQRLPGTLRSRAMHDVHGIMMDAQDRLAPGFQEV